jgi:hypothetical protein
MAHITSAAAVVVMASLATALSTGALGACKATLRGELVQAPDRLQAFPRKFLVFWLSEITRDNGANAEKRSQAFQSFVVPNASTTLPIPFALNIDLPKDCPRELELGVGSHDWNEATIFTHGDRPLTGGKTVDLNKFESISVWAVVRRF